MDGTEINIIEFGLFNLILITFLFYTLGRFLVVAKRYGFSFTSIILLVVPGNEYLRYDVIQK